MKNAHLLILSELLELNESDIYWISIFGYKVSERVYHDPVTFRADHPFIFAIWDDETNVILFMGKMSDPTV